MTPAIAMNPPLHATRGTRRVALVFASFSGGGIERSMLKLGKALLAQGLAVDLVVNEAVGELSGEVPEQAAVVEVEPSPL